MPRKLLKRLMPAPHIIHDSRFMRILGDWIHDPNLWHLNRRSASLAFFIGLFCAFLPIPFQMLIAAALAIIVRSNLPLSVGLVWITNPLTIGPVFYGTYLIGAHLLQVSPSPFVLELSWEWASNELSQIWKPLLLGSLLCSFFFGSVGFLLVHWIWRWHVVKRWEARKEARKKNPDLPSNKP